MYINGNIVWDEGMNLSIVVDMLMLTVVAYEPSMWVLIYAYGEMREVWGSLSWARQVGDFEKQTFFYSFPSFIDITIIYNLIQYAHGSTPSTHSTSTLSLNEVFIDILGFSMQ